MMPPSTKVAPPFSTIPPISRAVAGETALPSTYVPAKRSAATWDATSTAACGGQTERITSLARTTDPTEPASSSPAALARLRVAALRPSPAHSTRAPVDRTAAPTMLPISPGFRSPIVVMSHLPGEPASRGRSCVPLAAGAAACRARAGSARAARESATPSARSAAWPDSHAATSATSDECSGCASRRAPAAR